MDRSTGLICDQTIVLQGPKTSTRYPDPLRRIRVRDLETGKRITLLTNHFDLSAKTVADLYRCRWQVEIFFKWIKQHLRIKAFYGTSENAVKTQIWIAISVYVLVAIVKKRLAIERDLYTLLQILSVTLFEKTQLEQALSHGAETTDDSLGAQLVFALKWEGVNLAALSALFKAVPAAEIAAVVAAKPKGIYARRIWFLWEWLTGHEFDVPDPGKIKAVPVLDPRQQFALRTGDLSSRHKVIDNLPGTPFQ